MWAVVPLQYMKSITAEALHTPSHMCNMLIFASEKIVLCALRTFFFSLSIHVLLGQANRNIKTFHVASKAKFMGSIPTKFKNRLLYFECKTLCVKPSAKCINVMG